MPDRENPKPDREKPKPDATQSGPEQPDRDQSKPGRAQSKPGKDQPKPDRPVQSHEVRTKSTGAPAGQAKTTGPVKVKRKSSRQNPGVERPGLLQFTLIVIYKNLYILGITLTRRFRRQVRRGGRTVIRMRGSTYARLERIGRFFVRVRDNIRYRFLAPFRRIDKVYQAQLPFVQKARDKGQFPLTAYLRIAGAVFSMLFHVIATLFNHLAPFAAAALLIYVVNIYIRQPLGLEVTYNGEVIGYVVNETEFDNATQVLRDRFIDEGSSTLAFEVPEFALVVVKSQSDNPIVRLVERMRGNVIDEDDFSTEDEIADRIVAASGDEIELAYGLYIDNTFYGAVTDRENIPAELNTIRERNAKGLESERVEFVKRVQYREGLYPVESLVSLADLMTLLYSYETVDEVYTVEPGDSPSLISSKTGVPQALLLEYNPEIADSLYVGQEILLSRARPFLSVKNIYTSVYEEPMNYDTEEIETTTFAKGYREITQEGVEGVQRVTAEITEVDGIETERFVLERVTVRMPTTQRVIVGTNDPGTIQSGTPDLNSSTQAPTSSGFIWPTQGGSINVGVGGYAGHTGVDIPRPQGTPIYASASGTVVLAQYGVTGYGYQVMIDHGNGYVTRYAHASQLLVSAGDTVSQGDVIALVGRTGRSTGNHLHFEVLYNGRVMIPQNYIGG